MSLQHPNILYVGDRQRGQSFADHVSEANWSVYIAQALLDALGHYVMCMPDLVVIDSTYEPEISSAVYHHLRSIQAAPLLVLTDDATWDLSAPDDYYALSPGTGSFTLQLAISDILHQQYFDQLALTS